MHENAVPAGRKGDVMEGAMDRDDEMVDNCMDTAAGSKIETMRRSITAWTQLQVARSSPWGAIGLNK